MYDLPYHKAANDDELHEFIRSHPFASVIASDAQARPVATQLPLLLEERDGGHLLIGHLMKATDHHRALAVNPGVLVVFSSPHTYVSGSWYSSPNIPSTWNYMSVHVRGIVRWLDDAALEDVLRRTSLHFEGDRADSPTSFDNLPRNLIDRLIPMIAAFEIDVQSMESVFKLSQDRDEASYRNIIDRLRARGDAGRFIADEMEQRLDDLFPNDR